MKLGLYLGCIIPTEQFAYEISIRETLPKFGIELIDLENVSCCGGPLRSINLFMTMYLSARNLAVAEAQGLDILVPCPYCHLALTEAKTTLDRNHELRDRINTMLKDEGLEYKGRTKMYHVLDLLHDVIGIDAIKKKVKNPLDGKKIAAHYGCHLIRPHHLPRPDDSEHPTKMEALLKAIGAETEDYVEKLNCCGGPILVNHPESALTKTGQKLQAVEQRNFNAMATMCPWGQRILDGKQSNAAQTVGATISLPVIYYTQLLGLAMGISPEKLGLELNNSPVDRIYEETKEE